MVQATEGGVVEEIMLRWTEMFCDRRPLEPLVFTIISVAVHPLVHMITGFTNILLSTLGACDKVDNIGCLSTGVAPKLDYCPRRWLHDLHGGYHFAGFASCFAARSCLPKWFIITHVWWVSPTHKLPPETLLQKYSLQPCTSPQTYLLWFGHLWIKSKRTDWPPLQTGLSETGNFTCHWQSTATKERRLTFLQA